MQNAKAAFDSCQLYLPGEMRIMFLEGSNPFSFYSSGYEFTYMINDCCCDNDGYNYDDVSPANKTAKYIFISFDWKNKLMKEMNID
jgi:hypothetical protein